MDVVKNNAEEQNPLLELNVQEKEEVHEKIPPSSILKYITLAVLVVQNTSMTLTVRYSRTVKGEMYMPSTVIVFSEVS